MNNEFNFPYMTLMKIEIAHPNTESFDKRILCLLDTVEIAKIGVVIYILVKIRILLWDIQKLPRCVVMERHEQRENF